MNNPDRHAPVTLDGVMRCIKEYGAAVAAAGVLGAAIWTATNWLDDANDTHVKVGQHELEIRRHDDLIDRISANEEVLTRSIRSLTSIQEKREKEIENQRLRQRTLCRVGKLDRDWCESEYPEVETSD